MFPYVPRDRSVAASGRWATQVVLLAAAEMEAMVGREIDPNLTSDFLKFVGV